ncbi:MAG: DUF4388 domain-containing protein [Chloroflexota bacterium]
MAIQGDLFDFPLTDMLWFLGSRNKSGWLTLVNQSSHMVFTFRRGKLIGARSTDANQRLGHRLVAEELIETWQLDKALELQSRHDAAPPVGTILVELGFLTHDQLHEAISRQFGDLVFQLLIQPIGQFRFDPGIPDMRGVEIDVSVESEIFEAIRRADEWTAERMHDTPFRLNPSISAETVALVEREDRDVLRLLVRGPLTLDELAARASANRTKITESLNRLQAVGMIYLDAELSRYTSDCKVA